VGVNAMGIADSAVHDQYCGASGGCVISRIMDQSTKSNHLDPAPAGGYVPKPDQPVNANKEKLTLNGSPVYAAVFEGGMGYRNDQTNGIAKGDDPETIYMVTSGKHFNEKCCFDYGNAETNNDDDGNGTMEAVYFGTSTGWSRGQGSGPWVMADLENGLWAGNKRVNPQPAVTGMTYVTAMVKGDRTESAAPGQVVSQQPPLPPNALNVSDIQCSDTECRKSDGSCPSGTQGVGCAGLCPAKCGGGVTGCGCWGGPIPPPPPPPPPGGGHWAIKVGNAQSGELNTVFEGTRPDASYSPMKKQGAIILGIGGDNSNGGVGTFYEGIMTQGYTSTATDAAIQASIVAAGYGK
jgi:hypothetical protein